MRSEKKQSLKMIEKSIRLKEKMSFSTNETISEKDKENHNLNEIKS